MKPYIYLTFTLILLSLSKVVSATQVGFSQFQLSDNPERPLQLTLWYPTSGSDTQLSPYNPTSDKLISTLIADNIAFKGTQVIKDAPILSLTQSKLTQGKRPLVLLSHGYRGSWRNLNWLANKLVKKGYIVAAPDHPGTTTFNTNALHASQWWQRPNDLKRVIDYLLNDVIWQEEIDKNEISAIGHSLGGWSVMQLVGAQFNRAEYLAACNTFARFRSCQIKDELGLSQSQQGEPKVSQGLDKRIKKAVILDLGLARSFSKTSLNSIKAPVLILSAGIDIGDLPQAMESGFLAEHIPTVTRRYKIYEQATHFSFMQLCKPGAMAILEEEAPGDGIICKDGKTTNRETLHKKMFDDVYSFLINH